MIRKSIHFPGGRPFSRTSAAQVVQVAQRYQSRMMIEHEHKIVNAKSMLGLLSLGLDDQTGMVLLVEGEDEEAAAEAMLELLQ